MRERLIQFALLIVCGGVVCAAVSAATTRPTSTSTTAPAIAPATRPATSPVAVQAPPRPAPPEKHVPVPPPPPPSPVVTAPEPTPPPVASTHPAPQPAVVAAAPTTQPGPIPAAVAHAMGYAAGARIRARLAEDGRPADNLEIIAGVIAGLDDRDPAFPRDELQARFAEFQAYSLQRRAEKRYADDPGFRKLADDNLQKSRALMSQHAQMANVDVLPDGVQVQVLPSASPGPAGRVIGNAKFLTVNLKVSLADGTLLSSTEPGKPQRIAVADCLPALIDASRGMKVGAVWRVLLPPDKAYGLAGKPPVIGPNEAIEYEIELKGVE